MIEPPTPPPFPRLPPRLPPEVSPSDALLASLSEEKRWDPVPGSEGHQTPDNLGEDAADEEDEEGRGIAAQQVDRGVAAADRDQAKQAQRNEPHPGH